MIWQVVVCTLAAAGAVLCAWCLLGALLGPVGGVGAVICWRVAGEAPALEQTVRGVAWLRDTGLLDMPLELVDDGLTPPARERARRLAAAYSFIRLTGQETEAIGAGAGDPARDSDRADLSE